MTDVVCVLTAAGAGTRLGSNGPKALVRAAGRSLLAHCVSRIRDSHSIDHIVITAPSGSCELVEQVLREDGCPLALPGRADVTIVEGSPLSRQASVKRGIDAAFACWPHVDIILVHDAARPGASAALFDAAAAAVRDGRQHGITGIVPGLPVADTIKRVEATAAGPQRVEHTVDRAPLRAIQTPQAFDAARLRAVHEQFVERGAAETAAATDDAGLLELAGDGVGVIPGEAGAMKVTTPADLAYIGYLLGQEAASAE